MTLRTALGNDVGRRWVRIGLLVGLGLVWLARLQSRRVDADVSPLRTVLNKDPETWHLTEARIHWSRGRIQQATELLVRALHVNPSNLEVVTWLADAYLRQEKFAETIKLLGNYASHSTRNRNYYYRLGYCHARMGNYQSALGWLTKSVELDPYLLRSYVDIARIRRHQGFMLDAMEILKRALQISPNYQPALDEQKLVVCKIQTNDFNIFRKNNMVVHFREHGIGKKVEEFYPMMEAHRANLEDKLKFHLPEVHVKLVPKIERHFSPPAFYDDLEDAVYLTEAALEAGDHIAFGHELTWMYLQRMTHKNAPLWLIEGLALVETRPDFLDRTPLRTTHVKWAELDRAVAAEKKYLEFKDIDTLNPEIKDSLLNCYSVVRFMLESYGWPTMRAVLSHHRDGETQFEQIVPRVMHIDVDVLESKYSTYAISRFYFNTVGELHTKLPVFSWPKPTAPAP